MPRFKADALGRLLELALTERKATRAREKKLVGALSGLLGRMGYRLVEVDGRAPGRTARRRRRKAAGRRGRPRGRRSAVKRGRKPGRPAKARVKRAVPRGKG